MTEDLERRLTDEIDPEQVDPEQVDDGDEADVDGADGTTSTDTDDETAP